MWKSWCPPTNAGDTQRTFEGIELSSGWGLGVCCAKGETAPSHFEIVEFIWLRQIEHDTKKCRMPDDNYNVLWAAEQPLLRFINSWLDVFVEVLLKIALIQARVF
jgi:hypothetical protein